MDTMVMEAGVLHQLATATGRRMMRLEHHTVTHVLTRLGQFHQQRTVFVALEFV